MSRFIGPSWSGREITTDILNRFYWWCPDVFRGQARLQSKVEGFGAAGGGLPKLDLADRPSRRGRNDSPLQSRDESLRRAVRELPSGTSPSRTPTATLESQCERGSVGTGRRRGIRDGRGACGPWRVTAPQ